MGKHFCHINLTFCNVLNTNCNINPNSTEVAHSKMMALQDLVHI